MAGEETGVELEGGIPGLGAGKAARAIQGGTGGRGDREWPQGGRRPLKARQLHPSYFLVWDLIWVLAQCVLKQIVSLMRVIQNYAYCLLDAAVSVLGSRHPNWMLQKHFKAYRVVWVEGRGT